MKHLMTGGGLRRTGRSALSGGVSRSMAAAPLLVAALLAVQLLGVEDVNADASCRVPPSGLAGTVDEDGSVVLTWEASSCDPVNYAVYRRNRSEERRRQQKIATVDGDTLTYTDTGVEAGATYRYRVRSNDEGPRSGFAEVSVPEAGAEPAQQPNEQSERAVVPRVHGDTTVPGLDTATVDGSVLVLIYDEDLQIGSQPAASAYSVSINGGTGAAPSFAVVGTRRVTLSLATAASVGDTVTVSYTAPSTAPVQDLDGNDAAALTNQAVLNNSSGVFVSNTGQTFTGNSFVVAHAQEFTTGSRTGGYELAGVTIILQNVGSSAEPQVTIAAADGADPGTVLYTLTNPPSFSSVGTVGSTFTAPAGALLNAGSDYWVVVENLNTGTTTEAIFWVIRTDSDAEDSGKLSGWSIANVGRSNSGAGWTDMYEGHSLRIKLEGRLVNNAPINNAPTFPGAAATRSVAENSAVGTSVGAAVMATDADNDTLTYSLGGTDAGSFDIDSSNGQIKTKSGVAYNFEATKNSYSVTVNVRDSKDAAGNADMVTDDTIAVSVNLIDANDAPVITSTATAYADPSVAENTAASVVVATYEASDEDSGTTLTWSLSGDDSGDFTITTNLAGDGELKFDASPNYESPGDTPDAGETVGDNDYEVTVQVRDGKDADGNADTANDDTLAVTVTVTDVDEAGMVAISGALAGGEELTASVENDPDGSVTSVSWRWARAASATDTFSNISGATSAAYRVVAADVGKVLRATASYTDGHGTGKSAHRITGAIGASNSDPEFSSTMATRSVAENSAAGTSVGAAVATTDPDNDTLTYSLSGTDAGSFDIDPSNGQIKTKSGIAYNFEATKNSYSVTVNVRDSKDAAGNADTGTDDTIAVTINLTAVGERQ